MGKPPGIYPRSRRRGFSSSRLRRYRKGPSRRCTGQPPLLCRPFHLLPNTAGPSTRRRGSSIPPRATGSSTRTPGKSTPAAAAVTSIRGRVNFTPGSKREGVPRAPHPFNLEQWVQGCRLTGFTRPEEPAAVCPLSAAACRRYPLTSGRFSNIQSTDPFDPAAAVHPVPVALPVTQR